MYQKIFESNKGRVKCVRFHPNQPLLYVAYRDGCIETYNTNKKELIQSIRPHKGPIRGMALHPSLPMYASCSDDRMVKIHAKDKETIILEGHLDYVRSVKFHSVLPWIVTCSDDNSAKIWNWQSRKCIATLGAHTNYVLDAAFHPTQLLLITVSLDKTAIIWDIGVLAKTQKPSTGWTAFFESSVPILCIHEVHTKGVNTVDISPEGGIIATGADDNEIHLWDICNSHLVPVDVLLGHVGNVTQVRCLEGKKLISCSEDGSIYEWDIRRSGYREKLAQVNNSRIWSVDVKKSEGLMAIGHDNGLCVSRTVGSIVEHIEIENSEFVLKKNKNTILLLNNKTNKEFELIRNGKRITVGKHSFSIDLQEIHVKQVLEFSKVILMLIECENYLILVKAEMTKVSVETCVDSLMDINELKSCACCLANIEGNIEPIYIFKDKENFVIKFGKQNLDVKLGNKLVRISLFSNITFQNTFTTIETYSDSAVKINHYKGDKKTTYELSHPISNFEFTSISNNLPIGVHYYSDPSYVICVFPNFCYFINVTTNATQKVLISTPVTSFCFDRLVPSLIFTQKDGIYYALPDSTINKLLSFPENSFRIIKQNFPEKLLLESSSRLINKSINFDEIYLFYFTAENDKGKVKSILENSKGLFGDTVIDRLCKAGFVEEVIERTAKEETKFEVYMIAKMWKEALIIAEQIDSKEVWKKMVKECEEPKINLEAAKRIGGYESIITACGFENDIGGIEEVIKEIEDEELIRFGENLVKNLKLINK
eukprot:GAHX01000567.1.p1 GENE.GAHX01000567.1~~GAHX01000567.1.p1  ORF type:complete len:768 (-),score=148.03 GAHX01000567.1:27-2330(-)